jgi:hypothetical protein
MEHYRSNKNDMCEAIEETKDLYKLGPSFMSVYPLEEIDIGDVVTSRLTFVNKNLSVDYNNNLVRVFERVCRLFCLELPRNVWFKP